MLGGAISIAVCMAMCYTNSGSIVLDDDAGFNAPRRRAQQGFPVVPPRQAGGFICVPSGTCIRPANTISINPRILSPGQNVPQPMQSCPTGQVACSQVAGGPQCGRRYVNVNPANGPSTYGAFPWQAFIVNQTRYTGSGILVDRLHVLTAAHKVYLNQNTPGNVKVYMGVHNPGNMATAQGRSVVAIRIAPGYNESRLINDIAVLRLDSPIELGYQLNIGTGCLPPAGSPSFVNRQNCVVAGWGQTAFNNRDDPTNPQKQVTVPIVDYTRCLASMSRADVLGSNAAYYLDQNELCAGGQSNQDACTQDGGSPLVCPDASGVYYVAALVIWGKNCGRPNVYGVYVDILKYRNWIDQAINNLNAGR